MNECNFPYTKSLNPLFLWQTLGLLPYIKYCRWCCYERLYIHECYEHLLFVGFLMVVNLTGLMLYLIVVLIYISLKISDIECLWMCLLDICMSSLEKYLYKSHFFFEKFVFWYWGVWAGFVEFRYEHCVSHLICKCFLSLGRFSFCLVSFCCAKVLNSVRSQLFIFLSW